jgi:hypothetical protein
MVCGAVVGGVVVAGRKCSALGPYRSGEKVDSGGGGSTIKMDFIYTSALVFKKKP